MFQSKTTASLLALSMAGMLSACMQQSATQPAEDLDVSETPKLVTLAPPIQTRKPVPAVSISHEMPDAVEAGETGTVTFTVNEGYPSGTLVLEAKGGEGLDVFGATATTSQDMASATTHTWQVNYSAAEDGIYRLYVSASANVDETVSDTRAYAVEVKVGNWASAQSKPAEQAKMEMQGDGEPVVILEAEETID
ncbi:MAG: hypothetical protein AAGL11_08695 [Pseudomonadota bacterium]